MPFKLMETKSPKQAVRQNELSFESSAWTNTSEVAKDFLQGMLMKDINTYKHMYEEISLSTYVCRCVIYIY